MLKSLVQLFAEKFLTSKKEWVGRGIPLVSIARQTISNRLRQNSFPAKGQRNTSLVGGASC